MSRRHLVAWSANFLIAAISATGLHAQYVAAPEAYTVVETNAMFGPAVSMQIYRDGLKALVETSHDAAPGGQAVHVRTLYDLGAHRNYTWDLLGNAPCGAGTFSGDWGDPFAMSAEMNGDLAKQQAKATGTATLNGVATKVFESDTSGMVAKAWVEQKYGLIIKLTMTPKDGQPNTLLEVSQLSVGKPAASVFALPAVCAKAAAAPAAPTEADKIAALTGEDAGNFAEAIMPPAGKGTCTAMVRVVRAGSMQPITSGFQMAVDMRVDLEHPARYTMGLSANGRTTFSGGSLREVTGQMQNGAVAIVDVPPQFDMEVTFGKAGASSALIYRQCFGPETTLLLVVKNPERLSDGAEWLWVKSGKYAGGK